MERLFQIRVEKSGPKCGPPSRWLDQVVQLTQRNATQCVTPGIGFRYDGEIPKTISRVPSDSYYGIEGKRHLCNIALLNIILSISTTGEEYVKCY